VTQAELPKTESNYIKPGPSHQRFEWAAPVQLLFAILVAISAGIGFDTEGAAGYSASVVDTMVILPCTQGERHKPVYRFLARETCQFDAQPTKDAEKQRLQREHRKHLRTLGGPIYYEFSTPEELRELILSIDELREVIRPRRARIPFLPMHEKFTGRRPFLADAATGFDCGNCLGGYPTDQCVLGWGRRQHGTPTFCRKAANCDASSLSLI
jgi:hypothetical protein